MWEADGWAWRSQSRAAVAESIWACFNSSTSLSPLTRSFPALPLMSRSLFSPLFHSLSNPLVFSVPFFVMTIEMSSHRRKELHLEWSGSILLSTLRRRQQRCLPQNKYMAFVLDSNYSCLLTWLITAHLLHVNIKGCTALVGSIPWTTWSHDVTSKTHHLLHTHIVCKLTNTWVVMQYPFAEANWLRALKEHLRTEVSGRSTEITVHWADRMDESFSSHKRVKEL